MDHDKFRGYGVKVLLPDPESFLKIKETLTRIGIASKRDQTLYQSCHILHKQGEYVILHFKELFSLDLKETDTTEEDIGRRNTIVKLLAEWKLLTIMDDPSTLEPLLPVSQIKILSHKDKAAWSLECKYTVGKK